MSGTMTLLALRDAAKDRADMANSRLVRDARWTAYINAAKDELYDLLVSAYGEDYFTTSSTISLVSGTSSYSLPSDFYKLRGVDYKIDTLNYAPLKKFEFSNRNRYNYGTYFWRSRCLTYRYRIIGNKIHFTPEPNENNDIRIWYIPLSPNLSDDSDEFDGFNGWTEFVIIRAAILALRKEESDTSELKQDLAEQMERIAKIRHNRDAGQAAKINDVSKCCDNDYGEDYFGEW